MPFGLSDLEYDAFGSLLPWLASKSGQEHNGEEYAKVVMSCLLAVDTNTYFTTKESMTPVIRKILRRANKGRQLFVSTKFIEKDVKTTDMFSGEEESVLYVETATGFKNDCASEDSWAYHFILNDLICPSTREPIIALYRGRARTMRSTFDYKTLKVPSLFISNQTDYDNLQLHLDEEVVLNEEPFDLTNTIFFEAQYGIPQDRSFSYVYLRETYGFNINQVNQIGSIAAIYIN